MRVIILSALVSILLVAPVFAGEIDDVFGSANNAINSWYGFLTGPFAYAIAVLALVIAAISWIQNGRFEGIGLGAIRTFLAIAVILSAEAIITGLFGASAKGALIDAAVYSEQPATIIEVKDE
jgi:type IV secretory pathway VirB2 component (pilin)